MTDGFTYMTEFAFSSEQRAAIVAAMPNPLAHGADPDGKLHLLECLTLMLLDEAETHRRLFANGSPAKMWKKERKRILARIDKAEADGDPAVLYHRQALATADVVIEAWTVLGKLHHGRKHGLRRWHYASVMEIWVQLGGRLIIVRDNAGFDPPSGPLIDFMTVVLQPVLGKETPGPEGLRKIIRGQKRIEAAAVRAKRAA